MLVFGLHLLVHSLWSLLFVLDLLLFETLLIRTFFLFDSWLVSDFLLLETRLLRTVAPVLKVEKGQQHYQHRDVRGVQGQPDFVLVVLKETRRYWKFRFFSALLFYSISEQPATEKRKNENKIGKTLYQYLY